MSKKKQIWNHVIKFLETRISKPEIQTWFAKTALRNLDSSTATIEVSNKFVANWLGQNYTGDIQRGFKKYLKALPEIRFVYPSIASKNEQSVSTLPSTATEEFRSRLNKGLTFENFVRGDTNQFAFQAALEVAKGTGSHYNPLYIYGESSAGKTHLLNAIGNDAQSNRLPEGIQYLTADQFTTQISHALKTQTLDQFRNELKHVSLFLFDDVQQLSGRIRTQTELTFLFNRVYEAGKQIVFAGKLPPNRISKLSDEIKSRLSWGVITEIGIPKPETKLEIIEKKIDEEGISIPDDAAFYLAGITNDIKSLIQSLTRLETYASIHRKPINIALVKQVIHEERVLSSQISVQKIQEITARFFDISLTDLLSNNRKRRYSYPRQLAMYFCRQLTDLSFKEIGKAFHNKDHSTIMYAVKHITEGIDENNKMRKVVLDLESLMQYSPSVGNGKL
ncbi:MAG: chromosomal replication initiator protein DnaA [Desulfatiglandaceae bacterium]